MKRYILISLIYADGAFEKHRALAKREVCWRCDGEGKHSNPSIDGDSLSYDELHRDPDFAEAYFSDQYDVRCEECNGERVVDVVDEDALTETVREAYWRAQEEKAACERERAAERRWGA